MKKKKLFNRFRIQAFGFMMLLLFFLGQTAFAGEDESKATEDASQDYVLDEVMVTAQKRTENLQDVPISITAISESRLEDLSAREISDIQNFAPNVDFGNTVTNDNPAIRVRGISTSASNVGFEAGFGLYIDGVYMGRNSALNQSLADVELMEVLRGPQGTLFGKNTTTGALNIVTSRPGNELDCHAKLDVGDYGLIRQRYYLSGPLVQNTLSGKLTVFADKRDGYYDNIKPGTHDAIDEDQKGTRGELRYTPNDNLDIALRFDYADSDRYAFAYNISEDDTHEYYHPIDGYQGPVNFPGNDSRTISQDDTTEKRTISGTSLSADYDFGNGYTFTSISAFRDLSIEMEGDLDMTAYDILSFYKESEFEQLTQELRIASPEDQKFVYVAGLYFYSQEAKGKDSYFFDLYQGYSPMWATRDDIELSTNSEVDTRSAALFLDGRYAVTDRINFLFGARYTYEKKELEISQTSLFGMDSFYPDVAPMKDSRTDKEISPSLGLSFTATEDLTCYGRVARGFKSGGWNASLLTPASSTETISFDPEYLTNYELGFKSELLDNRLRFNAAVFYIDYKDKQLSVYRGLQGSITTNAGEARSMGFEAEIDAMPTNNLRIGAGVGFADAEYTKYDPDDTVAGDELDGAAMEGPKWTYNVNLNYVYPTSFGDINAGLLYSGASKSLGEPEDPDGTEFGATYLINMHFGVNIHDQWNIIVWCNNVTDRDNVIARRENYNMIFFNADVENYAAPRTFGMTVRYDF